MTLAWRALLQLFGVKSVCSSYCTNNSGLWSRHWSEREAGGQGQQPDDCPGRFVNPLVSRETWNTCMRTARELHLTCWLRLLRRTRFLHNLQFRSTMCPSVSGSLKLSSLSPARMCFWFSTLSFELCPGHLLADFYPKLLNAIFQTHSVSLYVKSTSLVVILFLNLCLSVSVRFKTTRYVVSCSLYMEQDPRK